MTTRLLRAARAALPKMSETERAALDAGTVWWDGELFSGRPRWDRLLDAPARGLSRAEQAFLDGPVDELCRRVREWDAQQRGDLSEAAWALIKEQRFWGMAIPREHGGLGFSMQAQSAVVTKLASHSVAAAVTVMVPNSLGPGELLVHYGTPEQQRHYLPRLARGEDIPCFALTEPDAGSDAAALHSLGVVRRGVWQGRDVLGIELDWNKRYTTLGPVATLIGLAFRLVDPQRLLGHGEHLGITCALVPAHLPGIEIGRRHDPLGVPFLNGPHFGRGVFVPLEAIIGGAAGAGRGWRMLMECLAAGRALSLPALAAGLAQRAIRACGAYASLREQFGLSIGRFEGIQERLAAMAGRAYLMNAARTITAEAVDRGERPAVVSAIVKAYLTEMGREVAGAAMDVFGGAGICLGPRNTVAEGYQSAAIGITVEGANVLTRSLIIYGQGALRCHPFLAREVAAVEAGDARGLGKTLLAHLGHSALNAARAFWLGLLPHGSHRRELTRLSAAFAVVSEGVLATFRGGLKRHELVSGRMADALAWMYLASTALRRFEIDGKPEALRPYWEWSMRHAELESERGLRSALDDLPRPLALVLRAVAFPRGLRYRAPPDALRVEMARGLLDGGKSWHLLTSDIYSPEPGAEGLGTLDTALVARLAAAPARARLEAAVKAGRVAREPKRTLVARALDLGLLAPEQAASLRRAERARQEALEVDAFEPRPQQVAAEAAVPVFH